MKDEKKKFKDIDPVMTISEVAAYLKITRQSVYNLINSGKLKRVKIGRNSRVLREDLLKFIDKLRV